MAILRHPFWGVEVGSNEWIPTKRFAISFSFMIDFPFAS